MSRKRHVVFTAQEVTEALFTIFHDRFRDAGIPEETACLLRWRAGGRLYEVEEQ